MQIKRNAARRIFLIFSSPSLPAPPWLKWQEEHREIPRTLLPVSAVFIPVLSFDHIVQQILRQALISLLGLFVVPRDLFEVVYIFINDLEHFVNII